MVASGVVMLLTAFVPRLAVRPAFGAMTAIAVVIPVAHLCLVWRKATRSNGGWACFSR
jgi:hypothetical protein